MKNQTWFSSFSKSASQLAGKSISFNMALLIIFIWAISGPFFHFSDTWQLVINTSTTIITFLMVFLIQNTQNRDTKAIQIKLDELIRATQGAHNILLDLEEEREEEVEKFRLRYAALARTARQDKNIQPDTGTPDIEAS